MPRKVVFDFDKTLTYKDTILDFFIHCANKNLLFPIKLFIYCLSMVLVKLRIMNTFALKERGINLFLKGLSTAELETKCSTYADNIRFNNIYYNDLKDIMNSEEADVMVVSASFIEYLKYIFPKERVIGSAIRYANGYVVGLSYECIGERKVLELNNAGWKYLDVFYTDSISDAPLAKMSKDIYLVRKDTKYHCSDYDDFVRKCNHL